MFQISSDQAPPPIQVSSPFGFLTSLNPTNESQTKRNYNKGIPNKHSYTTWNTHDHTDIRKQARELQNFGRSENATSTIPFDCKCFRFQAIKPPPTDGSPAWISNITQPHKRIPNKKKSPQGNSKQTFVYHMEHARPHRHPKSSMRTAKIRPLRKCHFYDTV